MEIWKDVIGYQGDYKISNLGKVKSIKFRKERVLKDRINQSGYLRVVLYKNGNVKNKSTHQLVAEAFLNHTPCCMELVVNHKNFIKTDNRLENLEIVTSRENSNLKHIKSSSKYVGVMWHKASNKWQSVIYVNGKKTHLGLFLHEQEASMFYQNALINHNLGLPIITKENNLTSKFKGICLRKSDGKWIASISKNKKRTTIGLFDTEIEAKEAYDKHNKLFSF